MARTNLPASQPFYAAARAFVEQALRQDGAIFTPGRPVWTLANTEDLYHRFVERADESNRSFIEKFRDQLAGVTPGYPPLERATPDVYQLAGELIYAHLLIASGNIGGRAKRDLITTVLSWSPAPVPIPPERDAALDHGLARVGTAYLTYRPFQLFFLLRFVRDWKRLPEPERARLLGDPWAFKAMLFAVPITHAYAQREALLHMVHPDTFEAIVSRRHKQGFASQFADLVGQPTDDVDRALLQIRTVVDQRYGPGSSLYTIVWPPPHSPLPRSLGDRLGAYVALAALLDGESYTPEQIVERLETSSQAARLPGMPAPDTLADDLLRLRLLQPLDGGRYRRWPHLGDASEPLLLRYAALTLLVPDDNGGSALPILRAPLDGADHPVDAWPVGHELIDWYIEAGLAEPAKAGLWRATADALSALDDPRPTAQAINAFLAQLQRVRASRGDLPPLADDALPVLDPDVLDARIAEIQRELLIDRGTIMRIYRALIAGHHIILSGPPGTGKTHLACLLPQVLWRDAEPTVLLTLRTDPAQPPHAQLGEQPLYREGYAVDVATATEDWGVRNVIGGITPQLLREGDKHTLVYRMRRGCLTRAVLGNYRIGDDADIPPPESLRRQEVLVGEMHYRGRWLVIDEFTRAPIDAAFGSLLTTLGGQRSPLVVPTDAGEAAVPLPRDFRLIGTLNSFDRHFLNQISEAMKRRFTFIDVLPPGPEQAAREQVMVVYRALRRLAEQGLADDITADPARGEAVWEDVLRVAPDAADSLALTLEEGAQGPAAQALDSFWRIFRAVRVYRQLGTAQAEAVASALFSGRLIGMSWEEALDSALADTLADQLQVLTRDEQRVLLAYLGAAATPDAFAAQVTRVLAETPTARQRAHLGLLKLSSAAQITADALAARFALGAPLLVADTGVFARRLAAFIYERGL